MAAVLVANAFVASLSAPLPHMPSNESVDMGAQRTVYEINDTYDDVFDDYWISELTAEYSEYSTEVPGRADEPSIPSDESKGEDLYKTLYNLEIYTKVYADLLADGLQRIQNVLSAHASILQHTQSPFNGTI